MKQWTWHIVKPFFLANSRRRWLALGMVFFCVYVGFSQSSTDDLAHRLKTAKKIGLVLGGGGARGLAHIGAIIALEEYGIYPKVLGGTSMGAIVGSVYAMGYTPRQMDSIFKMLDYNDIFFRSYKKEYPSIFFREFENNSLLHANMNGWKAEIPSYYSSSLPMEHLYNLLLVDQRKYDDFSSLDKEFYCIGTNVYQRKATTFDKGALISSVLSSAAYPFIFSPRKKGDDYFIDGGIFDNFPVDGMESRGVDFIIGVDVSDRSDSLHIARTRHPSWDRLLEALLVNGEDTSMQSKVNKCQIYVHPSVDSISSFDFTHPQGIIKAGYLEMTKMLESLGIKKENTSSFYKERAKNYLHLDQELRRTNVYIDTVEYLFSEKVSPVYKKQLQTFFPLSSSHPTRFNVDYVRQAMDVIYNTNNYEAINYSYFKKDTANAYGLRINATPKQVKYELLASASFSDLFGGEFMLGYLNRNLFFRNSYLSFQFLFGNTPRYNLNYYLDRGAIPSFGFSSQFYFYSFSNKFDERVLREKDALPSTSPAFVYPRYGQYTFRNQFYIKSTINRSLGIQAGLEYNWMVQKNDDRFGRFNSSSLVTNIHQINLFGKIAFNTLNDKLFTHHGVSAKGEFKILDFQDKISSYAYSVFFEGIFALPVSRKVNFLLKARLANIFNFSGEVTTLNMFKLGGAYEYNIYNTASFMGYRNLELFTRGYMYGFAGINYQAFKKFYVMFGANIANVMRRQSSLFSEFYKLDYVPFGMSLMLGYDSAIAPFMVGAQYSPEGGVLLTFRLGYIY